MKKPKTYTFTLTTRIETVNPSHWDAVVNSKSIYLNRNYLQALEQSLNKKHQFYYILVSNSKGAAVAVLAFQSAPFIYTKNDHSKKILSHFNKNPEGFFTKQILVCGNVFATGETGFAHTEDLNTKEMGMVLIKAISKVLKFQKKDEKLIKTKVSLVKEFFPESLNIPAELLDEGYQNFSIDVNMVLPIANHWKSLDDYLKDVTAKYRTRANSVFKKSKGLTLKELNAEEIASNYLRINELFENVLAQSDYRFGQMDAVAFAAIKKELGSLFIFKGLFKEDVIIGFSTAFINGNVLEANYVGIDYTLNGSFAIYQRLLYDYVNQAVVAGVDKLQLGRTSELLKSSLGAVPVPMTLFAKHNTSITHLLMASILKKVSASPYELRKPFKAVFYERDLSPLA